MSLQSDPVPTKIEKTGQLERILCSDIFLAAPKQARVLRFVVEHAIAGTEIDGTDINTEMFRSVDPDSSNARTNVSLVRQRLKDYYEGPGSDDLVRIELPPGPGYRATFSYHQKSKAIKWFRKGVALRNTGSVESLLKAKVAFNNAIAIDSGYVSAHAAKAEVELLEFLAGHVLGILPENPQTTLYKDPEDRLKRWKFDAEVWLLHVVVGIEHLVRGKKESARQAFESAMQVDAEKTRRSVWYATYLVMTGRESEGLLIAEAVANEQPENIWAFIIFGLFLYVSRDFERADSVLLEMVTYDQAEVFHDLVRGLVRLSLGEYNSALELFENASVIRRDEWNFLMEARGYTPPQAERFPGLIILALAKGGNREEARKRLAVLSEQRFVKPFQLAIAYLAVGEHWKGVQLLNHACKYGDILVPWLRLWAFFDDFDHPSVVGLRENLKRFF